MSPFPWFTARTAALFALATSAAIRPGMASGQEEPELPTPEEVAERAERAARAPLFLDAAPLVLTLRADITWLRDERSDEAETEGTVTFESVDGATTLPVKVRARGNFRRDKRNCNFPPLRLNFATKQAEGTVFEDQDKVKLVTPCHDSRDNFQQYVLQEYLVYKVYELLTPIGYRTRLVRITYEDTAGEYETRTRTGFLIESDDAMAERNRAQMSEWAFFHPVRFDERQASLMALFQYMIGNTDFSAPYFHNTELIRKDDGTFLPVPYDFDWSGVVNARYAVPDPQLSIANVRQRVFRGFCREGADHGWLKAYFLERRDAVRGLYEQMPELEDGERKRALEYYDKFYELLGDDRKYEREIVRACLEIPTG